MTLTFDTNKPASKFFARTCVVTSASVLRSTFDENLTKKRQVLFEHNVHCKSATCKPSIVTL